MYRLLLYIFLFSFTEAIAQTGNSAQQVLSMFDKPKKVEWVKHFKGRIDDVNDIGITLAYDGKNCKGQMQYLRSKETFQLEGSLNNDNILKLKEKVGKDVTGYINASLQREGIIGEWSNADYSVGGRLLLHPVSQSMEFPSYCGDNKWIHFYYGVIAPYESNLLLHKENGNRLHGILYIKRENKSYQVSGDIDEAGNVKLRLVDNKKHEKGYLEGTVKNGQVLDMEFISSTGKESPALFRLEKALPLGCVEYADFMSSYDITYPKTNNVHFNKWMEALSDKWVNDCRAYSEEVKQLNPKKSPSLRSSVRAFAWPKLILYDGQLVSGSMTMSNTWSNEQEGRSINFDLIEGKEILLEDIFRKGFRYDTILKYHVKKHFENHLLYRADPLFRKWINASTFSQFAIAQEGLYFSTDFDATYGQQQVVIPYSELKPYFSKDNPIAHLYQHIK